ncbi:hypothetical protein E1H12_14775 [Geitlerinema sp. P-1104]|uniref:hypothetical protein n=1 Tax=Geitlerinema sp. P-1104 TaxID=2546230 RepID=UPI001476D5DF|nr:hypothetical protein [Geitlerinema sp. P-1104]NMG59747.1 hypothetical protein [Geitlerinema sp. P-1104]
MAIPEAYKFFSDFTVLFNLSKEADFKPVWFHLNQDRGNNGGQAGDRPQHLGWISSTWGCDRVRMVRKAYVFPKL